jgi:hypothetical protein
MEMADVHAERVIETFSEYMSHGGYRVSRAQFEKNLSGKLTDPQFTSDITPLLASDFTWNVVEAGVLVSSRLITLLPGDPWKGDG